MGYTIHSRLTALLTVLLKVMTAHPECATLDTSILDALHIMHDGKFLHIPVVDGGNTWLFFSLRFLFMVLVFYIWPNFLILKMNRRESCCLLGCSADYPCSHFNGLSAHAYFFVSHSLLCPYGFRSSNIILCEGWRRSWDHEWCGKHNNAKVLGLSSCFGAPRWGIW